MFVNGLYTKNVYPDQIMSGCIWLFENVWDSNVENIEEKLKENNILWERSTVVKGHLGERKINQYRTNFDIGLTDLVNLEIDFFIDMHNSFFSLILDTSVKYAETYGITEIYQEPYNILKYSGGQEYKAHYDGSTSTGRSFSAICYLNDNYSGGEIEFTNFNLKIKPKSGSLLLFPSNFAYTHIAHPVTDGTKYAIVTWIHDRPL